jgi:hypothetical protein
VIGQARAERCAERLAERLEAQAGRIRQRKVLAELIERFAVKK